MGNNSTDMKSTQSSGKPATPAAAVADNGTPQNSGVKMSFTFLVLYLAGISAFGSFVNDMFSPSLPSMSRYFSCPVPTVQLGMTAGMLGLGIGQILLGPFSFKYGRKPVLIASIILFVIAAVVSIYSPTINFFLVCRLFQGIGASGGYFLARTIPADVYMGPQLAKCMAVMGAVNGFAPASAPIIGGFVSQAFTWKGVFWVLTGFAIFLLCISPWLKETLPVDRRAKGSVWSNFRNYPRLFRNKSFMIHAMFKGAALGLLFAYVSSAPFIFQTHFGWSQSTYGIFIGVNALFVAAGSMLSLKFKPLKRGAYVGSWILVVAVAAVGLSLWFVDSFWLFEVLLCPMLFALGMIFAVTNTLAMNEGRAIAGAASAILGVVGYIFGAIVAPLSGIGNMLHSVPIVMMSLALITFYFSLKSRKLAPDLMSGSGK